MSRVKVFRLNPEEYVDKGILGHGDPCWNCGNPRDLKTAVKDIEMDDEPARKWRALTLCSHCYPGRVR